MIVIVPYALKCFRQGVLLLGVVAWAAWPAATTAGDASRPDPVANPLSSLMLDLPATGTDPTQIDFARLPQLDVEHAVISQGTPEWQFRLHEYLAWHDGRFWCIWSHGPVIEDRATQHIQYATSENGLDWSEPQQLVGPPKEGYGYIARGLWIRDGQLLALASLFDAPAYPGEGLCLKAFAWNEQTGQWDSAGTVLDDSLNNFPPKKLPNGQWMMSRRNGRADVSVMIGGVAGIDQWDVVDLAAYRQANGQRPEEPYWYVLPDGQNIVGLFRNNSGAKRLLRAFSTDHGRTWSEMTETNFPDATSKFFSIFTSGGYYALVSNPNPKGRNPLCLSLSRDGLVYTRMAVLPVPDAEGDTLQYPHVIEHDGYLYVVYSRNKRAVEIVRVSTAAVDSLWD